MVQTDRCSCDSLALPTFSTQLHPSCLIPHSFTSLPCPTHAVVNKATRTSGRQNGYQAYTAFPKLLVIGLAAAMPSLVHAAVRVFAWEKAFVSAEDLGAAVGVIIPVCAVMLALLLWLIYHSAVGCAYEHPREGQVQQVRFACPLS